MGTSYLLAAKANTGRFLVEDPLGNRFQSANSTSTHQLVEEYTSFPTDWRLPRNHPLVFGGHLRHTVLTPHWPADLNPLFVGCSQLEESRLVLNFNFFHSYSRKIKWS